MPSNPVIDDHGERLRTLEGTVSEIKTDTALHAKGLEVITEKISEGFRAVNERLDKGAAQFETHEKRLDGHHDQLKKIEHQEDARHKRLVIVKKATLPLLAAAAGVIAHAGGGWIWQFLAALFGCGH